MKRPLFIYLFISMFICLSHVPPVPPFLPLRASSRLRTVTGALPSPRHALAGRRKTKRAALRVA